MKHEEHGRRHTHTPHRQTAIKSESVSRSVSQYFTYYLRVSSVSLQELVDEVVDSLLAIVGGARVVTEVRHIFDADVLNLEKEGGRKGGRLMRERETER